MRLRDCSGTRSGESAVSGPCHGEDGSPVAARPRRPRSRIPRRVDSRGCRTSDGARRSASLLEPVLDPHIGADRRVLRAARLARRRLRCATAAHSLEELVQDAVVLLMRSVPTRAEHDESNNSKSATIQIHHACARLRPGRRVIETSTLEEHACRVSRKWPRKKGGIEDDFFRGRRRLRSERRVTLRKRQSTRDASLTCSRPAIMPTPKSHSVRLVPLSLGGRAL
jgi:hypothetical protein